MTTMLRVAHKKADIAARRALHAERILTYYLNRGVTELWLLVCLDGAMFYGVDLMRDIRRLDSSKQLKLAVATTKYTRYRDQQTGSDRVDIEKAIPELVAGRHVLVVEDVADHGVTLKTVINDLKGLKPLSINVAVMTAKPMAKAHEIIAPLVPPLELSGWSTGYGLDRDYFDREEEEITEMV